MGVRKGSTNTAKTTLNWKEKRKLHKQLRDDSKAAVSRGVVRVSTNRPLWSIERDEFIRERFDMDPLKLLTLIEKNFGIARTPSWRYLSKIRSKIKKNS